MSASKKKQARKEQAPERLNKTKLQQETTGKKGSTVFYGVAIVAAVVIAAVLLVFNSSFFQNRATAVTIDGQNYTAADVNFYYTNIYQYQQYYAMMGMSALNPNVDPRDQVYDEETGDTWYDFMVDQAVTSLTQEVALATEAEKAGMSLSEESRATVNNALSTLETSWLNAGYANRDTFLRTNLGSGMTYDKYVKCLERSALASQYANAHAESIQYTDEELDAYYTENKDDMDTYVLTHYLFQAKVPTETDADGKAVERTEEETAALLEDAKKEAKANAEALLARLEAGEDAAALEKEFADKLSYSFVSQPTLGSTVNAYYSEWAFDAARQDGDITMEEYAVGDSIYNYCVARLEDRYLDDSDTTNVRHIFLTAGTNPTDEEFAKVESEAQAMLDQWKADGALEDDFAQLAKENSQDSMSAEGGGLLNVSIYDGYGQPFMDWVTDSSRKAGDTGLVKNDFGTTKGYHIMYYVGQDVPYWEQAARTTLLSDALTAWQEEIFSAYTAEEGSGLKYVG